MSAHSMLMEFVHDFIRNNKKKKDGGKVLKNHSTWKICIFFPSFFGLFLEDAGGKKAAPLEWIGMHYSIIFECIKIIFHQRVHYLKTSSERWRDREIDFDEFVVRNERLA